MITMYMIHNIFGSVGNKPSMEMRLRKDEMTLQDINSSVGGTTERGVLSIHQNTIPKDNVQCPLV